MMKRRYKKNQLLNARVKELEDELASAVTAANNQADYNVTRYTDFVNQKHHLADLKEDLLSAKDETVEAYTISIARHNDRLARLKLERELKWKNYESYFPEWLKFLTRVQTTLDQFSYSNHTKWRSAINNLLRHSVRSFADKNGATPVTGEFRRFAVAFNAYSADQLKIEVNSLIDKAGDVEGMNDPTFQLLRLEYRMARDAYRRCEEEKMYRDEQVQARNEKKVLLREEAKAHREALNVNHYNSSASTKRNQNLRTAKLEASDRTKELLMLALRLPVTRENEAAMEGKYNQLLAYCANSGDWFGAVTAYESFVKRGFVPNKFVFGCIVGACKRADPPQVDRAVLVLDEMKQSQIPVSTGTYNAVLDCCRSGGAWRRGVHVFENMQKEGVKPNTNTYAIMAKLGFEAKNDDPGEIYSALKFAGVPEYIAYSAAASNALRVEGGGKSEGMILEEELDGLTFRELPYIKGGDIDPSTELTDENWEIERAVERILKVGGKGVLAGEDDRTVSTMSATVLHDEFTLKTV